MDLSSSILQSAGLWAMGSCVVLGAVWVVALRNLFRAALSLGLVLVGVAGIFLLLEAEFLAFVQILIYVGAILTLVVFAIMLTTRPQNGQRPLTVSSIGGASRQRVPAALASGALFFVLTSLTRSLTWPVGASEPAVSAQRLGQELVTTLVLPFEMISLLFVAVMVGAIAVAASPARSSPDPGRAPRLR